jgi:hypothetical protein
MQFQGRQLFYSYATCGSTFVAVEKPSTFESCSASTSKEACEQKELRCMWDDVDKQCASREVVDVCSQESEGAKEVLGQDECKCIGIQHSTGSVESSVADGLVYPANVGASCKAWDLAAKGHPDCNDDGMKDWCSAKWCYVDPCSCTLNIAPTHSHYLPKAKVGKVALYYSYETCGEKKQV